MSDPDRDEILIDPTIIEVSVDGRVVAVDAELYATDPEAAVADCNDAS